MVLNNSSVTLILPPDDLLSDEPPLDSYRHMKQLIVLLTSLERLWRDRIDFFAAGNMSVYYCLPQHNHRKIRGPDFFVVLGTERKDRKSWIVWEENGRYPNFILELLSDTKTAAEQELKKRLYQDIFRTPDYFWFDPYDLDFNGLKHTYHGYEAIEPNSKGWLWSEELQLYLGIENKQLRFFTPEGELVPTPEEAEIQEQERAEAAQQRADQAESLLELERQRAERAEAQLEEAEAQLEKERQRVERLHRFAKYIR